MQLRPSPKPVIWVGSSRRELKALPRDVQRGMGRALWLAQCGLMARDARRMRGARLRAVTEMRDIDDGRAYRLMYTTVFPEAIYVLCAFEKKSTHGIGAPARWLRLVEKRWRDARTIHESAVR